MAGLGSSGGSGSLIGVEGDEEVGLRGVNCSASEGGTSVLGGRSSREAARTRTAVCTSRCLFLSQVSVSERLLLPLLMVAICCGLDGTLSAPGRGGGGGGLISTAEAAVEAEGRFAGPDPSPFAGKHSSERFLQATGSSAPASSPAEPDVPPCATILNASVITACTPLVDHQVPDAVLKAANETKFSIPSVCFSMIRNIVVRPNASGLYYLVSDMCVMGGWLVTTSLQSIMAVSFEGSSGSMVSLSSPAQQSQPSPPVQVSVLSYVWPVASPSGPPPASPPIAQNRTELDSMLNINTAALSSDGSHLIMAAYPSPPTGTSWVVSLDVISGARLSTPVSLGKIWGLAFSPNYTALYLADSADSADSLVPPRILVAEVAASTPLLPASLNTTVFLPLSPTNISNPMFGPYSFTADGSCLYFLDGEQDRVWALHIASRKLIPLSGSELSFPFPRNPMYTLLQIAVTSDGRNVFFTDYDGKLHLITLDSACGSPLSYQIVARRLRAGMWGLAISPDDKYLYVGTLDGRILKLDLGQLS
ncbi:hypothetical protein CBR_g8189 [Chara braunii]|uniref:Uncharacterized protein n=1 Tax=Chara braunii TaxID=69332 RepID=A0A388KLF5_CHABU|nr:hypothetical protein CBR_g8189 [Chara braunii]|eukprot:GBG70889.1 hypothetical protein CBR_g8189 [Chara braunii]